MSFLDLWDCFDDVRENWIQNRCLIESFLDLSKQRLKIEKSHCKKLEKVCSHQFFSLGKNTLVPALEKFQNFYMSKLINSKNLIVVMQTEIIQPMRDLLYNQDARIREKVENCKKIEHEKQKISKACELSKEKYWKSCKDTLLSLKHKQDYMIKEEEAFSLYSKQLEYLNRFNVLYVEEIGKNLLIFQICEEERSKYLRESLRKLHETEERYVSSILGELESIPIVT